MESDRLQSTDLLEEIRSYLQQWFPAFSYRKPDDYFFAALYVEFRDLDLLEEIKVFHAWCLTQSGDRESCQQMSCNRIALLWAGIVRSRD